MTHGRTLTRGHRLGRHDRPHRRRHLSQVNPYFHMFGLKAGILASVASGATMLPEPVFDTDRVLSRVAAEHVTVLPGPPTLYQAILEHPARDRTRPLEPARRGDGGRRHPGRADPTGARRAAVLEDRHRLRAHRRRHRLRDVRRGRRGGHRHHGGPAAAGFRGAHRRRRPRRRCRRSGRGPARAEAASWRATWTIPRRRPRCCPPTGGCVPATSGCSTTPAACASSAGSRTCSSSAGSTRIPPRSRTPSCAIPR